ncbi:MAG: UDP-N-acetylglucosamine--N-acetylmuramyl-(pentapeptide) pyrophosphoryl-undecaprenol N-acetylglucosamine transferase [Deltaproteobacteria bacterium]|nr:MAG: UDP-N-acetylglucosamine--N-acetylmuramyl-(pentapeptide) pyrophosphoryl-undecaprenol N-acetylglucosamine transferase [Deltaproteobacteria bacterium]
MKYVIVACGSGGHMLPGVFLGRYLQSRRHKILFVCSNKRLDVKILKRESFLIRRLNTSGSSIGLLKKIRQIFKWGESLIRSFFFLKRFRPFAIIGLGGASMGLISISAWILKIPVVIVENNSTPGGVNLVVGKYSASAVFSLNIENFIFFSSNFIYLHGSSFLQRNFIENTLTNLSIVGGSQGSGFFNFIMPIVASRTNLRDIKIMHQVGKGQYVRIRESYDVLGCPADLKAFISNLLKEYARTLIMVSRAGASSIFELMLLNRYFILIPMLTSKDSHQVLNSCSLQKDKKCFIFSQTRVHLKQLVSRINLSENISRLNKCMYKDFP